MAKIETATDVVVLSRWAQQIYLENSRGLEPGLKDIILGIGRMEDAPEFEYSSRELSDLAKQMIAGGQ